MKEFDLVTLITELQTNTGTLVVTGALLVLAIGAYYVYSREEMKKRFNEVRKMLDNYEQLNKKLGEHYNKYKTLKKSQYATYFEECFQ